MSDAAPIIAALDLSPHPEGGWYRETYRAAGADGARGSATAILFLLEAGQRSHWHRVDADELWLWHAGAALTLSVEGADDQRLGGDVLAGERPQSLVPAGAWQATAAAVDGWGLASCVVSPAFHFAGFELAPADWSPPCR